MALRIILSYLLGAIFTACSWYRAPNKIRNEFAYESQPEYRVGGSIYVYQNPDDSSLVYHVFFEDGTYAALGGNYFNSYGVSSIHELLEEASKGNKKDFYRLGHWGYYETYGDSLFIREIAQRHHGNGYWSAVHERLIVQENTMRTLSIKQFYPTDKLVSEESSVGSEQLIVLGYYDTCNCVESDSWLKYEKWFWKDEHDYEQWIKKSGGNKKKYRY